MDINSLVKLTARAWALPILALLHDGTPGRQAPLLAATGAGRTAFAQSMAHLIDLKLVTRNAGHGHPLRPEFILTDAGHAAGALASRVLHPLPDPAPILIRRAWTVPVLCVSDEPLGFTDIKRRIGPITDRALSHTLKGLQSENWMQRDIAPDSHPPRALYHPVNLGAEIHDALHHS